MFKPFIGMVEAVYCCVTVTIHYEYVCAFHHLSEDLSIEAVTVGGSNILPLLDTSREGIAFNQMWEIAIAHARENCKG